MRKLPQLIKNILSGILIVLILGISYILLTSSYQIEQESKIYKEQRITECDDMSMIFYAVSYFSLMFLFVYINSTEEPVAWDSFPDA